eukprot:SAG22_NODE_473_length_10069_cov_17.183250_3_plen_43_part_00
MVENKKKRDAGKVKRRKQVKKTMKDVETRELKSESSDRCQPP